MVFSLRVKKNVEKATGELLKGSLGACNWLILSAAVRLSGVFDLHHT